MKTIVGLFDTYTEAQDAVSQLRSAGIPEGDISLVANPSSVGYEDTANGGTTVARTDTGSNAASGAGTGAGVGAAIGGTAGLLAGLGVIMIPGFGQAVAVGWLVSALTGAGLGAAAGAVIGGLAGALTAVGVPETEAGYYAEGVRRGGALVTVRADDNRAQQAADILNRAGAVDIEDRGTYFHNTGYATYNANAKPYSREEIMRDREAYRAYRPTDSTAVGSGMAAGAATAAAGTARSMETLNRDVNAGREVRVPVVEEQIEVGKRQVQRGGARIHTHVTERPVQETVNLREEHLTVDRRPADRPVAAADMAAFREGTIEVTETAEVPVVNKAARVVEEVVIGKQATERQETVRDTVRRTDVQVDQTPGATTRTAGTTGATVSRTTGNVDTRGVGERIADAVTGDPIDDKTGNVVKTDTRGIGEKAADAVTGDRVDDKTGKVVR